MSSRWDNKYRDATTPGEACALLQANRHLLPTTGKSMDIACGLGGNALLLAQAGLESYACDASSVALEKLQRFAGAEDLTVHCQRRDFEDGKPGSLSFNDGFDVIVVSFYLYRPLLPSLVKALNPGGLLFYQTFSQAKRSQRGPSNPDFLLQPGELLSAFSGLELIDYHDEHWANADDQKRSAFVDPDIIYFTGRAVS